MRALPEFWSHKEPAWRGLKAAAKSEALNPKSETNPNHQNSKFKTNHNGLFRRWLWQQDSNIKQKKQEVERLYCGFGRRVSDILVCFGEVCSQNGFLRRVFACVHAASQNGWTRSSLLLEAV
jgi:hypothetical protein